MASKVVMPPLGEVMEEGKVLSWLKREGETVEKGDPLFEVETDKVTMVVEAQATGTLLKVLVPEGSSVPIGTTLAFIGQVTETVPEE